MNKSPLYKNAKIVQKESILSRSNFMNVGHHFVDHIIVVALKGVKLVNSYRVFSGFCHFFNVVLFQGGSGLGNEWRKTESRG